MPVRVVNAEEAAALDAATTRSGVPSRALMRAAAFNSASVICARYPDQLRRGVTIVTGSGNNGGDGWALASALRSAGIAAGVREVVHSGTPDAQAEREIAASHGVDVSVEASLDCGVVVDAMLGTGASGDLRGAILGAANAIAAARSRGAVVVALDLPSGVDAGRGAHGTTVVSDLTVSFGAAKRGSLISRAACGEIVVVDIGLSPSDDNLPVLVDAAFVNESVPVIAPDAHKGTRKSVAIVAGGPNMGGAAILAATGALRSGVGLVQVMTAAGNVAPMHTRIPEALVAPLEKASETIRHWADAVLIGPGLGTDDATAAFIRDVIEQWRGPVVLDAGALSAFAGNIDALAAAASGRPAIITPHPGEMARLIGSDVAHVLDNRFDIGADIAKRIGAVVLLKGTPTVVFEPGGTRRVVAAGTPVLATGGSGDALSGIVATLLAQGVPPGAAAACAAWIHGRAAELTPGVRGNRLTDVLDRLPMAWKIDAPLPNYPVVATLPAVA